MARRSRTALHARAQRVYRFMDSQPKRVFLRTELGDLLKQHREPLELPSSFTTGQFIQLLHEPEGRLHQVTLKPENPEHHERPERYVWGSASPYAVALSLRPGAYLSHGSACFINALTDEIPKTIYVNKEQTAKESGGNLSQAAIDRAFKNKLRTSNYSFEFNGYRIVLLSGKFTGRLEVSSTLFDGQAVDVTKVERTLIDITVRPTYGGGPGHVLEAYATARTRISVNTLVATYKKLNYVYPYHQAIGFYMQRAGYSEKELGRLDQMPRNFDFYLDYKMKDSSYDSRWRIHYPKSLENFPG